MRLCIQLGHITKQHYHFVMECGLYANIRKDLIKKFICGVNKHGFIGLMKTTDIITLRQLGQFVYMAFNLRRQFLTQ
jgi:hypothetical protein